MSQTVGTWTPQDAPRRTWCRHCKAWHHEGERCPLPPVDPTLDSLKRLVSTLKGEVQELRAQVNEITDERDRWRKKSDLLDGYLIARTAELKECQRQTRELITTYRDAIIELERATREQNKLRKELEDTKRFFRGDSP